MRPALLPQVFRMVFSSKVAEWKVGPMFVDCPTLGRDQGWYQHSQLCWELRISTETAEGAVVFGWPRILGGDFFLSTRQNVQDLNSGCPSFTDTYRMTILILHIVSQLLTMASLKGFEHLMFCILLSVPVFPPGLCSNTQGPHCGSQAAVGVPRESQWIQHPNPIQKRFKRQASKLPRLRLGQIIQNGLASPQAEIQRKQSFCMFFVAVFSLAFSLQQVKHKVATFLVVCEIVGETEKKGHVERWRKLARWDPPWPQ